MMRSYTRNVRPTGSDTALSVPSPSASAGLRRSLRWRVLCLSVWLGLAVATGSASGLSRPPSDPQLFETIEKALAAGSAEGVLASAGRQVEVRIFGKGTLYSKAQALFVLADFLKQHPPARFTFTEYAASDDRRIAFGSYWEEGRERSYAVYVNLRQRGDGWELRELRVEGTDH